MKTMTCEQLGGSCGVEFTGETFEEIVQQSKLHGMEMFQKQDAQHMEAMKKIQEMMNNQDEINDWFNAKRKEFDSLETAN
jgi:PHP family Zn ribbon phosphoesterase